VTSVRYEHEGLSVSESVSVSAWLCLCRSSMYELYGRHKPWGCSYTSLAPWRTAMAMSMAG
jgi:hypothetical protein